MSKDSLSVTYHGETIGVGSIVKERATTRKYIVAGITHASEFSNVLGQTYLLAVGLFKTSPDNPRSANESLPSFLQTKLFLEQVTLVKPEGKELIEFLESKVDECLAIRDEESFKMYSSLLAEEKANTK